MAHFYMSIDVQYSHIALSASVMRTTYEELSTSWKVNECIVR